jgi:hypothetical protein
MPLIDQNYIKYKGFTSAGTVTIPLPSSVTDAHNLDQLLAAAEADVQCIGFSSDGVLHGYLQPNLTATTGVDLYVKSDISINRYKPKGAVNPCFGNNYYDSACNAHAGYDYPTRFTYDTTQPLRRQLDGAWIIAYIPGVYTTDPPGPYTGGDYVAYAPATSYFSVGYNDRRHATPLRIEFTDDNGNCYLKANDDSGFGAVVKQYDHLRKDANGNGSLYQIAILNGKIGIRQVGNDVYWRQYYVSDHGMDGVGDDGGPFFDHEVIVQSPQQRIFDYITKGAQFGAIQCCSGLAINPTVAAACSTTGYTKTQGNILCTGFMSTSCTGANVLSNECVTYCSDVTIKANCDSGFGDYCNPDINSNAANIPNCACFLGNKFYGNYLTSLRSQVNGIDSGITSNIPACFYDKCQLASVLPYNYKTNQTTCPNSNVALCIQNVNVDNQGNVQGNININPTANCNTLQSNHTTTGTGTGTSAGDSGVSLGLIGGIIAGIVGFIIFVALLIRYFRSKPSSQIQSNTINNIRNNHSQMLKT